MILECEVRRDFPNGVDLNGLISDMLDMWPDDLRSTVFTANGRQREGLIKTGLLSIETERDLTESEISDAKSLFSRHTKKEDSNIMNLSRLGSAKGKSRLPPTFVSDCPRKSSGLGCLVYSDDSVWRRVSDDEIVVI